MSEGWWRDSHRQDLLSTLSPHLHSRHKLWKKCGKAPRTFPHKGDRQEEGRLLGGVACLHLIITTADVSDSHATCTVHGHPAEGQAGQILRKRDDEVGDGQATNPKPRGSSVVCRSASVCDCASWWKSPNRPGHFKRTPGEEWLLSRTPVGAQDTRQP